MALFSFFKILSAIIYVHVTVIEILRKFVDGLVEDMLVSLV